MLLPNKIERATEFTIKADPQNNDSEDRLVYFPSI